MRPKSQRALRHWAGSVDNHRDTDGLLPRGQLLRQEASGDSVSTKGQVVLKHKVLPEAEVAVHQQHGV
eukprot:scaffold17348_cov185-Skeletonema_dohrnii-CCMP3373.AAC.1